MNKKTQMMKCMSLAVLATLSLLAGVAQADTKVRTNSYEYTAQGLLSKEVQEPNSPNDCLQTSYSYDSFGNRTGSSASICSGATGNTIVSASTARTSAAGYGTDGRFPVSSSNALAQTESRAFDPRFGGITSLTGPNALTSSWIYDSFGRKTRESRSDGTYTTWSYKLCTESGANCPSSVGPATVTWVAVEQGYAANAAVSTPEKRLYYSRHGRLLRVQTQGFDGAGNAAPTVLQDTEYNAQGQVARQSRVYASTDSPMWTSFEYDAVGRVVSESHPDAGGIAQTTYVHSGLTTTRTRTVAALSTDIQGGQWAAPTVTASQGPSPWVATLPGTLSWSSTNASVVSYQCTSAGAGFTANQSVAPSGTSASVVAGLDWVSNPSTCVFTAAGPGGTATYSLTVNTSPPPRRTLTVNVGAQSNYLASVDKVANVVGSINGSPVGYLPGLTDVVFVITGNLNATAVNQYGLTVDASWHVTDTVKIVVNSGVYVVGMGGAGGSAGSGGSNGGPAMRVQRAVAITNNGTIGGGGGGGGGSGYIYPWGAGGGGGAGFGTGGAGRYPGSTGQVSTPGSGSSPGSFYSGSGGVLGGAGQAGSTWEVYSDEYPTVYYPAPPGGAGGAAIVGNSFVTWTVVGTRLGALQ